MSARIALGAAILACAAGCASKPEAGDRPLTSLDAHKIGVTESTERLALPVAPGQAAFETPDLAQIEAFGRSYARSGHGALVMTAPQGSENAEAAMLLAHTARAALAQAGVPFSAIASATYSANGEADAPIVFSYLRYVAQAPECAPLWTQDLSDVSSNSPWPSFGCATQANFAAMLAEPGDLISPREEEPRDAARRAQVLEKYREGVTTHADRSPSESIQISKTVK